MLVCIKSSLIAIEVVVPDPHATVASKHHKLDTGNDASHTQSTSLTSMCCAPSSPYFCSSANLAATASPFCCRIFSNLAFCNLVSG